MKRFNRPILRNTPLVSSAEPMRVVVDMCRPVSITSGSVVKTFQLCGGAVVSAPAEGTPTLELRDVSKAFGQVIALRSGSLTLYSGSIHALVGENGAGKSTLVKIIAGLYHRDSGT